jgi:hypothetical protein
VLILAWRVQMVALQVDYEALKKDEVEKGQETVDKFQQGY